ncbi:hypothetical protein ACFOQM_13635 [Paenibacillus sp. GCM10012307]|uniref:Uncharacterized protein n=1 Tax=Paenibacillus roseus TaxID=2798579 RepID=A0A934MLL7_9BACL|nr:hypothetical protein [Paenibacillus roseus]MBJ6362335.1 hypothetical protein [Paenibacillus roseus]
MKHSRRNRRHGVAPGYKMSKLLSQSIIIDTKGKDHVDQASKVLLATKNGGVGVIYVGPSVEGVDKEYVKVLTGNVDSRKPSFV